MIHTLHTTNKYLYSKFSNFNLITTNLAIACDLSNTAILSNSAVSSRSVHNKYFYHHMLIVTSNGVSVVKMQQYTIIYSLIMQSLILKVTALLISSYIAS